MPETPTLVQPLQVGVANGQIPVAGASVRFDLVPLTGNGGRLAETAVGAISGAGQVTAVTGADGLAACHWRLDPNPAAVSQRVKATLLDCAGNAVHLPVFFNANLSLARQVSYDPDNHAGLQGKVTVQDAIDALYGLGSSGYTVILGPDTSTSNWQRILDGLPQGASIRFRFKGTAAGVYDIMGPDGYRPSLMFQLGMPELRNDPRALEQAYQNLGIEPHEADIQDSISRTEELGQRL